MAYLGNAPLLGAYTHVDDISSGFDGNTVTFNITKNSISKTPVRAENFLVSIDGVFQEPYESYSVTGSTVTFTEAPASGSSFFGIILGNVLNIGAIPDGSVTVDKMGLGAVGTTAIVDGAVTTSKIADVNVTTAKLADASVTTDKIADVNITTAKIADSAVTTDKIADSAVTQSKLDLSSNLSFVDNEKAIFGTGSDLQIYHDGTDSFISDEGTGRLILEGSTNVIIRSSVTSEWMFRGVENGATELYYNNSKKIATTNTGVDITGELLADSYNESYAAVTSSSGTASFNCEDANTFSITLSESVTTTNFQNPPASGTGYTMTIEVIQDSGGSGYSIAWPTSVDWPSATAPTLTATASGKDIFVFTTRDGGTTWYGFTAGQAIG